jgi:hypothetical protein
VYSNTDAAAKPGEEALHYTFQHVVDTELRKQQVK